MSDIATEYRTITTGAGSRDRSERGCLRFDGRDGQSFLQALVSNEVAALVPGQGVYATYLTAQGRMIADLRVYHRGPHLLADVPASLAAQLAARFDAAVFSEDVVVSDVSGALRQIAVIGRTAAEVVARALDLDAESTRTLPLFAQLDAGDVFVARTDDVDWPSYDVFMPAAARDLLAARLSAAGGPSVSPALGEVLRIEAGRPAFGIDMTDETIPLEAGLLDRAISTTKGCYVGQEIIIRVLHRGGGRVAKRLVRLDFDPAIMKPPAPNAVLAAGEREVGKVTSAAFSPQRGRVVALGYVHRDFAESGRRLTARLESGDVDVEILGLAG